MAIKARRKPPKKPKTTYTWFEDPHGIRCVKDRESFQTVAKLWEASELSDFHDAELAQATKEINTILSQLDKKNKDRKRKLSLIEFQSRHLLVWAEYGVGPDDDEETVIKALRIKT